jgi:hypothetical protein
MTLAVLQQAAPISFSARCGRVTSVNVCAVFYAAVVGFSRERSETGA